MTAPAELSAPDRIAYPVREFAELVGRSPRWVGKQMNSTPPRIPSTWVGPERMVPGIYARAVFAGQQLPRDDTDPQPAVEETTR